MEFLHVNLSFIILNYYICQNFARLDFLHFAKHA